MKHITRSRTRLWMLLLLLLAVVVTGCSMQVAAETITQDTTYTGVLDTSYENALDPVSQLALGTLNLEDTPDAVTETQAAELLPVWQVLQSSKVQGDAEQYAAAKLIEANMSEMQLAAIAVMQFTQEDAAAWMQDLGNSGVQSASDIGERQRPDNMPDLTEEQMAAMQARFEEQGGSMGTMIGGGNTQFLNKAVVSLLSERSGTNTNLETSAAPDEVKATPIPEVETESTSDPVEVEPMSVPQDETAQENVVDQEDVDEQEIQEFSATPTPEPAMTPEPEAPSAQDTQPAATPEPKTTPEPEMPAVAALVQIEDTDPGPPLTIEIRSNTATQDPLVADSQQYQITGLVRNDGTETYAVSALNVTFYDAQGFRGSFQRAAGSGRTTGGEWVWHGQTEADFACLLLAPGESCPFSIEITAQDMASFLIHPDAVATDRESAPVVLSNVQLTDAGTGYLHISGTATNNNAFEVKNVTVSGVLLDNNGQIVSLGSGYVLQEDIAPGTSVDFDLRIAKEAYTSYQLYAQAERDWD